MRTLRSKGKVRNLHKSHSAKRSEIELAFLLHDWSDPYNVGGLFRVADACGAVEVVLCGKTPSPPHPQISVTSLGHHRRVQFQQFIKPQDAVSYLKQKGYALVAVEIADSAECYTDFAFPAKTCLVLGNEQVGINETMLRACDHSVFIPMAGKGRSLNVHVAASIIAFEALYGRSSAT